MMPGVEHEKRVLKASSLSRGHLRGKPRPALRRATIPLRGGETVSREAHNLEFQVQPLVPLLPVLATRSAWADARSRAGAPPSPRSPRGRHWFRRRWLIRADARRRSSRRLEQREQTNRCRTHGPDQRGRTARCGGDRSPRGRGRTRRGVTHAPRSLTPIGGGDPNRLTLGETRGRDRIPTQSPDTLRPPAGSASSAIRADSGEVKRYGGREFESPRLHSDGTRESLIPRAGHGHLASRVPAEHPTSNPTTEDRWKT